MSRFSQNLISVETLVTWIPSFLVIVIGNVSAPTQSGSNIESWHVYLHGEHMRWHVERNIKISIIQFPISINWYSDLYFSCSQLHIGSEWGVGYSLSHSAIKTSILNRISQTIPALIESSLCIEVPNEIQFGTLCLCSMHRCMFFLTFLTVS